MSQSVISIFRQAATKLFLTLALVLFARPTHAQTSDSLPEQLTRLENARGYAANSNQSILERLQALELKTLGSTGNGSIFERLSRLQGQTSGTGQSGNLSPPASGPGSEPSQQSKERIANLIKSANLTKAMAIPNTYPSHFFRVEPAPATAESNSKIDQVQEQDRNKNLKADYFNAVMDASKNRVFKFENMPIPVFIVSPTDQAYGAAALAACGDWERRSQGLIRFAPQTRPDAARIKITWAHLGNKSDSQDSTLGGHTMTKWTKKPSGRLSLLSLGAIPVPLYIPTRGPKYTVPPQVIEINLDLIDKKDADIRYLTLRNIVAHELGHAIGLLGHSPNNGDLMFPITDEHSRISERDLNTIKRLYDKKTTVPL